MEEIQSENVLIGGSGGMGSPMYMDDSTYYKVQITTLKELVSTQAEAIKKFTEQTKQLNDLTTENTKMKLDLADRDYKHQITIMKSDADHLQALNTKDTEIRALQQQIQALQQQAQGTQPELERRYGATIEEQAEEIKLLKEQIEKETKFRKQSDEYRATAEKYLSGEQKSLVGKIEEYRKEKEANDTKIKELNEKLLKARDEDGQAMKVEQQTETISILNELLTEQKSVIHNYEQHFKESHGLLDLVQKQLTEQVKKNKECTNLPKAAEAELLATQNESLRATIKTQNDLINDYVLKQADLQKRLYEKQDCTTEDTERLKNEVSHLEKDLERQKTRCTDLENSHKTEIQSLKTLLDSQKPIITAYTELSKTINELTVTNSNNEFSNLTLSTKNDYEMAKLKYDYETKLLNSEEKIRDSEKTLKKAQASIDKLTKQLTDGFTIRSTIFEKVKQLIEPETRVVSTAEPEAAFKEEMVTPVAARAIKLASLGEMLDSVMNAYALFKTKYIKIVTEEKKTKSEEEGGKMTLSSHGKWDYYDAKLNALVELQDELNKMITNALAETTNVLGFQDTISEQYARIRALEKLNADTKEQMNKMEQQLDIKQSCASLLRASRVDNERMKSLLPFKDVIAKMIKYKAYYDEDVGDLRVIQSDITVDAYAWITEKDIKNLGDAIQK